MSIPTRRVQGLNIHTHDFRGERKCLCGLDLDKRTKRAGKRVRQDAEHRAMHPLLGNVILGRMEGMSRGGDRSG